MKVTSGRRTRKGAHAPGDEAHAAALRDRSLARYEGSHPAMGTIFSIVAYGASLPRLSQAADRAFQEIDRLDDLMSHYKPESELCAINREAARQSVVVTPELFSLVEECLRYSEETGGAFDITIGPLMKLWGFFHKSGRMPEKNELEQTLQRIGYRHVHIDAGKRTVAFGQPGIEFDLGAIGKGYAVDRVVAMLRAEGVTRALVSSGTSSIYALGAPPGKQGWQISLCHPLDRRKEAVSLRLKDLSISISGGYEQCFALNGRLYTHLLDPRSGAPVEDMLMAVVIAESNTASDALSTAFFVAGVDASRLYLRHHPNLSAILYRRGTSTGAIEEISLQSTVTHPRRLGSRAPR